MAISLYQASLPVFLHALNSLSNVLGKGEKHAQDKGTSADQLLRQRLIFDMYPLIKQIQIACDTATRSAARLAGMEPKSFPDTETTLAQAQKRIETASAYIKSFKPGQIDGRENHTISMKMGGSEVHFTGQNYLFQFALPNFYFHCTTAYDILRVAGASVGKHDFLGL